METLHEAWSGVLNYLHTMPDLSEVGFNTWISLLEPRGIENNRMVLYVDSGFQRQIILEQYGEKIKKAIWESLGLSLELDIITGDDVPASAEIQAAPADEAASGNLFGKNAANYEYSFENFIVGSSNKYAHAASQAVAKNPAGRYNPLFIYGGSGLGKTHLLYAICNEIKKNTPDVKILYTTCEYMTNELIESLRNKSPEEFRTKYRQVDVLMVDDIQFLAGKEATQEEFFHTFEALHQANKQIVLTSDRPPKEIATLSDRLRSRFEMGLLADIQPPDLETRIAIVKRKAQIFDIAIDDEVASYIAGQLKSNVRQLEGVIKKLRAQCELNGERASINTAKMAIRDLQNDNPPIELVVDRVIGEVSRTMNVTPEDIRSQKRTASVSRARQVSAYVVRSITGLSTESTGKYFGARDHSTIVYAVKKVEELMERDPSFRGVVNDIIKNVSEL